MSLRRAPEGAEAAAGPPEDRHAAALDARSIDFSVTDEQAAIAIRRAGRSASSARRAAPAASCPAGSPTPTPARTTSSAPALDRSPMFTGVIEGVGAALLPVHRGQDQPLCRQGLPPDLPRARGPDDQRVLPERHQHLAALRHAAQCPAHACRAWRTPTSCAPATPSSTTTSTRATSSPRFETKAIGGPVLRRPDQRHHRLRRSRRPRPARRHQRRPAGAGAQKAWCPRRDEAYLGVLVDDLITRGVDRALPDVHHPRRVPPAACARTTPTCA